MTGRRRILTLGACLASVAAGVALSPMIVRPVFAQAVQSVVLYLGTPFTPTAVAHTSGQIKIIEVGASNSFTAQTATGATAALVPDVVVRSHAAQIVTTGTPAACTYDLEGSNDGGTSWFDILNDIDCAGVNSNVASFAADKPALRLRGQLDTLTGGTSPSVRLHYAGR